MTDQRESRFEFGKNWSEFVNRNFSQERVDISRKHILRMIGEEDLSSYDFLDIGCGSGLHSLAAYQAGARRVRGFDFDLNSVSATQTLHTAFGSPENWSIEQGDVLNRDFVSSLGKWNFVYSWGVLHHTGYVWEAINNATSVVARNGVLYLALYSADVQPRREFWLEVKKEYIAASEAKRNRMIWWYIWEQKMGRNILRAPTDFFSNDKVPSRQRHELLL